MQVMGLAFLGIAAGVLSGFMGIGGGIIIIPALVYLFGFSQHSAQGTTLALLVPPIGFFAAYAYYKAGFVDIKAAVIIAAAFIIGSLIGTKFAIPMNAVLLQKVFGVVLLLISLKYLFAK